MRLGWIEEEDGLAEGLEWVVDFHGLSCCVAGDGEVVEVRRDVVVGEVVEVRRDVDVGEFEGEVRRELKVRGVSVRREVVSRLVLFFVVEVVERLGRWWV